MIAVVVFGLPTESVDSSLSHSITLKLAGEISKTGSRASSARVSAASRFSAIDA